MHPITEKIPKALVDVAGKPFILRQLEYFKSQNIHDVVLCVSHLGEQIEAVIRDGKDLGLKVSYSWDGPKLLGTAGAIKKALPLLGNHFFVHYGDSYLPIDFEKVEKAYFTMGKKALMTILKNENRWDKSNVIFRNSEILDYDKRRPNAEMTYIDYGLGILHAGVFDTIPKEEPVDLADIYHMLARERQLAPFEVFQRFYEIGSPNGLDQAIEYFSRVAP